MFVDYHVHCDYSDDSWYIMEDVIKDAIKLGLDEICFTDHVDYGVKIDWNPDEAYHAGKNKVVRNVNYPLYFRDIEFLTEKYKEQITVKTGLEFGMQMHTINEFQKLYNSYPFDFILLSIHQVGNQEFWTGEFQKGRTNRECYELYYEELYSLVKSYKDYSCLAHMDLIRRYLDKEVDEFEMDKPMITKILKQVIKDGKGIELNTSSKRYGINGLTPSIEILKLYYELGGTIITIGSDSHKPEHLSFDIKAGREILKDIGFKHFCTFDKMKPIFHDL